jgi:cell division protein FtsB
MIEKSILPALYTGIIVYLLLNLFWGNQGINALNELRDERENLEYNMEVLSLENRDVQIHLDQLKNDRISISLLARKLGYIKEGEKIIYSDLGGSSRSISYGLPILRTGIVPPSRDRGLFFRGLSFTAGLIVFLLLLILEWGEKGIRRSNKKPSLFSDFQR